MIVFNIHIGCAIFFALLFVNNFLLFGNYYLAFLSALAAWMVFWFLVRVASVAHEILDKETAPRIFNRRAMITVGMIAALIVAAVSGQPLQKIVEPEHAILTGLIQSLFASFGFGLGIFIAGIFSEKK